MLTHDLLTILCFMENDPLRSPMHCGTSNQGLSVSSYSAAEFQNGDPSVSKKPQGISLLVPGGLPSPYPKTQGHVSKTTDWILLRSIERRHWEVLTHLYSAEKPPGGMNMSHWKEGRTLVTTGRERHCCLLLVLPPAHY